MPFNHVLLKAWRQHNHLTRKEVAEHLCVSHTYYVKLENGERRPSLEIFESISQLTGIDAESLLGSGNAAVGAVDFSPAILQKEAVELRRQLLESDAALFRKDQTIQELIGVQGIREKILNGLMERNEAEYRKVLARVAGEEMESGTAYDQICRALKINNRLLLEWAGQKELLFRCPFELFEPVTAPTPEIAGMKFGCLDCEFFNNLTCKGFGLDGDVDPEDLFVCLEKLEAGGIRSRKDQVRFLREHYGFEISEHTLCEYVYRHKKGKRISPNIRNMRNR
nr:helix-turn-helix transcriptional regulator [uncultured Fretibacterium sp.]